MRTPGALLWTLGALSSLASAISGKPLTDQDLRNIPSPGADFDIHNGKLLAPILIPRVPGTPGQTKAQAHLVNFFQTNLPEWKLTWHNSTSKTPMTGDRDIPFDNIIVRRDPPWAEDGNIGRLTLVAHYDSKLTPLGFIGATDSAAPCAMLLHVARSLEAALRASWRRAEEAGETDTSMEAATGLQIIFLDGEEAFLSWTEKDSLYGARALAEHWGHDFHAYGSAFRTPLGSISLFVLLDLLGTEKPQVPSYFLTTHWAYQMMARLESRLRGLGLLETRAGAGAVDPDAEMFLPSVNKSKEEFSQYGGTGGVEDDHIPFLKRGVPVLHLIPQPFPHVWHTMADDGGHLHLPTVRDWAKLVTAFAAEWMDLSGLMPGPAGKKERRTATEDAVRKERTEL